ncbi:MAG TPA: Holliday junction branch migration protein RuvA [Bacteroidota bacterium]|nr:Holliday junction branch migration protein RuvA [Bacteroidota bacterium]
MISRLRGLVVSRTPTELTVDVNGVGYQVSVPLSTSEALAGQRGEVTLLTYLHVREDALLLYGFATEGERGMFRMLISVSGIGPKLAQGILSGIRVDELRDAIASGNLPLLGSVSGVGRKTAERLVMELRGRITDALPSAQAGPATSRQLKVRSEAVVAMMSLGHTRGAAEKAIQAAVSESRGTEYSIEELLKKALAHTMK